MELTCLHWQSYADDLTAELQSRVQARNQTGPKNVQEGSERIEVEQEDGLQIIHVSFTMKEDASRKQSNSADEVTGGSSTQSKQAGTGAGSHTPWQAEGGTQAEQVSK